MVPRPVGLPTTPAGCTVTSSPSIGLVGLLLGLRARGGLGQGFLAFVPTSRLIRVDDDPALRTVGSGAVFGSESAASLAPALGHLA